MFLGIEIGGTKLQLGIGAGDGSPLIACRRCDVDPQHGAAGILRQIESEAALLMQRHPIQGVGIGFGGPVNSITGKTLKSHQIQGWDDLPLGEWCRQLLAVPVTIGNDCDVAAFAEAQQGAGQGYATVFYVTVGTGIGGGLVQGGVIQGAGRPAIAEIGHLRPGVHCDDPEATVESVASGWGIVATTQARGSGHISRPLDTLRSGKRPPDSRTVRQRLEDAEQADAEYVGDLRNRCGGDLDKLTARLVAQAAADGNEVAREVLQHAIQTLGWAIAQAITLLAPEVVVVGGGVSLIGESGFFAPLRRHVERFVFPPLRGSYQLVPAALGELVVVQGALALAAQTSRQERG
jgi:glucokinase